MKAKTSSHISKWIAAAIVLGAFVLKGLDILRNVTVMDAIYAAAAIAVFFSPIDINLVFEKLLAIRGGSPVPPTFPGSVAGITAVASSANTNKGVQNAVESQNSGSKP